MIRTVLFTRSSRPSGAQMAWRLHQSGIKLAAVVVENRGRMVRSKQSSILSFLVKLGPGFFWKKILELVRIRSHFWRRKFFGERFKDPVYLSIEEWALDHPTVRVYEVDDHNGPQTQELLWRLEPDIGVLTNTRRIKKNILDIPRHRFLNLHLSALPQYAGLDSIFWALYHGEKKIGVTVHFVSEDIDRGNIVLQRKIKVGSFDNERTLYEKALWLGTSLMVQAVNEIQIGNVRGTPQDPNKASYFSWPTPQERMKLRKRLREGRGKSTQVLHLITRMTRGGAQENTLATVLGLQRKGYSVTLVTGSSWGEEGEILSEALEKGVEVVIFDELIREIHPWKDLIFLLKLSSWLAKNPHVIIHTHSSKAGFLGRLAGRIRKIPVIVHTPHGHVFHSYFRPWKEKLFLKLERRAAHWADRLIALTERCQKEHLDLGVGRPEQWVTIPSGVNETRFVEGAFESQEIILHEFHIPSGRKRVGFVGRLAPIKGARYLVEAFQEIAKQIPESHCIFVGDGEERIDLQERVKKLGLSERVTFTGHRPQSEVSQLMAALDVLVVPSLNEGMGRVIVEAGLLAKPVVGTRVGGIPDLIKNGQTGLLVEPENSNAIANAVTKLFEDSMLSEKLGQCLRQIVLNGFTECQMVDRIHALYQEVLHQKGISLQHQEEIGIEDDEPTRETALSSPRPTSG